MEDSGAGIWAWALLIGTIVLGGMLAYGTMHYRRAKGPTAPRSADQPSNPTAGDTDPRR